MRAVLAAVVLLGAAAATLTSCQLGAAGPAASRAPDPIELVIVHSNDNWGATRPCG